MKLQARRRWVEMALIRFVLWFAIGSVSLGAQASAADIQKVESLLRDSKYNYKRLSNATVAVWILARRGEQAGNFEMRVTTEKGIVVAFVTVAYKNNMRMTAELIEKLLQINHDLDYAKVGIDEDGDVFGRIDTHLRIMDVEEMNDVIAQVSNTTDTTYVALKPYLIR